LSCEEQDAMGDSSIVGVATSSPLARKLLKVIQGQQGLRGRLQFNEVDYCWFGAVLVSH